MYTLLRVLPCKLAGQLQRVCFSLGFVLISHVSYLLVN